MASATKSAANWPQLRLTPTWVRFQRFTQVTDEPFIFISAAASFSAGV
jgi:hypothetical protein